MNLLGIETSSKNISLGLLQGDSLLVDFNQRNTRQASSILFYIEKYIKRGIVDLDNIDAFVVGGGPGSFTGLRISFSIIKAFHISLNKPVIVIGSFFSCAYHFKDRYKKIAVIADARRNYIYAASFRVKDGELYREKKEKLTYLQEFIKEKEDYFFITPDCHLRGEVVRYYPYINFYSKPVYPKAKYLLFLGRGYYCRGEFSSIEKLEPFYIYPKTCQVRNV
jgi:tRNA threonylcarbamoyladenosine biosynthesis protein TsaB